MLARDVRPDEMTDSNTTSGSTISGSGSETSTSGVSKNAAKGVLKATGKINGEGGEGESGQRKGLRIPGACDICKRKKTKCDSGQMPDNRCSNCVQYGYECTHKAVTKTLGSAKGYVESLEARLEKMNQLLNKLSPGIDVNNELENLDAEESEAPLDESLPRNDEDRNSDTLPLLFSRLMINPRENRFFGKSSSFQLLLTAIDLKRQYHGIPHNQPRRPPAMKAMRSEMWSIPPWAPLDDEPPQYVYPPADLVPSLIEGYFANLNQLYPLLHRPSFEENVASGLHLSDHQFGAVLLLVCAHGAKFVNDPRVLMEGFDSMRSAGWKWFRQVLPFRQSLFSKPTLHELQVHALHVSFAQSNEMPQGSWAHIGVAVRLALEMGAHRKRNAPPGPETELWKRAFWVILALDRQISAFAGRPCGLQDEDFDIEPCLECDDEYWGNDFEQPAGRPSSISFFNSYIRLMDILGNVMRSVYAVKRPVYKGVIRSDQQVITELDSMMNNWMDSIPSHLKWNQTFDSDIFLKQSAALHATYYHIQILIHRPFIPTPRNPHPTAFPSLAICTNAARSCCHVLQSFTRVSVFPHTHLEISLFTAAVILLLNVWSGRRAGQPFPRREMEDVQGCIMIFEGAEDQYASAGRLRDALAEMLGMDKRVNWIEPIMKKRTRDDSVSNPSQAPSEYETSQPAGKARRLSFSSTPGQKPISVSQSAPSNNYNLPVYSAELGSLPVHGQFNFLDSTRSSPSLSGDRSSSGSSAVFDHFLGNLSWNGAIPPIPSSAEAYAIDALVHGQSQQNHLGNHPFAPAQGWPVDSVSTEEHEGPIYSSGDFAGGDPYGWGMVPDADENVSEMWKKAFDSLMVGMDMA